MALSITWLGICSLVTLLNDSVLDYVDNPAIATDEGSWILKLRHFVCRISTIFVCQTVVTIALLVAVEVQFDTPHV